jgi:hypothetical protein
MMDIHFIDYGKKHHVCTYLGKECHVSHCKYGEDFIVCETYRRIEAKANKDGGLERTFQKIIKIKGLNTLN